MWVCVPTKPNTHRGKWEEAGPFPLWSHWQEETRCTMKHSENQAPFK